MSGVFVLVTKIEHWYLQLSRFNYCCPAWCYAFRCEISKVGWSDPPRGEATHLRAPSCSSAKTLVITLCWIFRSIIWFLPPANEIAGRLFFSSVCLSIEEGVSSDHYPWYIAHRHTVNPHQPCSPNMGLQCTGTPLAPASSASDIWWPRLDTCSNTSTRGSPTSWLVSGW